MRLSALSLLFAAAVCGPALSLPAQVAKDATAAKDGKSKAAESFKALADKQQERIKALQSQPRDDREAFQKAIHTMLEERTKDLEGFIAEFKSGPEVTKARLEVAQASMQNKDLADHGKAALGGLDLKDSDLKTTIQAAMMAGGLELADKRTEWIELASKKATSIDQRLELAGALKSALKEDAKADALMAEIEKNAKSDDDKATILMHKATMARRMSRGADKAAYAEALGEIVKLYPKTGKGKLAAGKLAAANLKAGGDPVPFATNDLDGKPVSPADYKGKVLLIDFWATWCGPCMAELPHVLDTYAKHHAAGFEILGISLDRDGDREKLVNPMTEKGMTWRQVYDGKYWEAEIAQLYDVQSIPFTLLIGKDGKVAGTNLRGKKLEEAVAEALAAK